MSGRQRTSNLFSWLLLVSGVLVITVSAYQAVVLSDSATASTTVQSTLSPPAPQRSTAPVPPGADGSAFKVGSTNGGPLSNVTPAGYSGHYWIGSQYSGSSKSGTTVQATFVTPADNSVSGDFYYALLSLWGNAGSYDQTGLTSDYGTWEWMWSWTSNCAGTYYYNPGAYALSYGVQYAVQMKSFSNGTVEFLLYFQYIQSGDLLKGYWASTGGTSFNAAATYSCNGNTYGGYTDYEEVYTLSQQNVPNWPIQFTNNIFNGAYQNSWSSFTSGSPPSVIKVVISKANTTIANEGWMGPVFNQVVAGRPGVANYFPFDVANLACSPSICNPISVSSISYPSGWTVSYSPSSGDPNFWFNATVTPTGSASGDYTIEIKLTNTDSGSSWNGYYTTFLVVVDVSSCTRHCGTPAAPIQAGELPTVGEQPALALKE